MEKSSKGGVMVQRRMSARYFRWWLGGAAVLALSCERPEYSYDPDLPVGGAAGPGFGSFGGASTGVGGSVVGPIGAAGATAAAPSEGQCLLDQPASSLVFSNQTVNNQLPARRVVYLQMTDEEAARLEETGALLPEPTQPAKASTLTTVLTQLLSTASEARRPLLQELLKRFQATRAAWPNPWALRLLEHPSSQHMNPVRLTFKEDAWIVRLSDATPAIVDMNNAVVSLTAATLEPERIAAIYYVVDDRTAGAVATCESGKRELALGNPSMVESFSIGTPEILERLNTDIAALESLFRVVRPCTDVDRNGMTFHAFTVCQSWRFFDASTEYLAYQWSLSNPMEAYKPTAQNLSTLIQALKDDRFEPRPVVGVPVPVGGAAGEGGEGGEAGAPGEGGAALGGAGGVPGG